MTSLKKIRLLSFLLVNPELDLLYDQVSVFYVICKRNMSTKPEVSHLQNCNTLSTCSFGKTAVWWQEAVAYD